MAIVKELIWDRFEIWKASRFYIAIISMPVILNGPMPILNHFSHTCNDFIYY